MRLRSDTLVAATRLPAHIPEALPCQQDYQAPSYRKIRRFTEWAGVDYPRAALAARIKEIGCDGCLTCQPRNRKGTAHFFAVCWRAGSWHFWGWLHPAEVATALIDGEVILVSECPRVVAYRDAISIEVTCNGTDAQVAFRQGTETVITCSGEPIDKETVRFNLTDAFWQLWDVPANQRNLTYLGVRIRNAHDGTWNGEVSKSACVQWNHRATRKSTVYDYS